MPDMTTEPSNEPDDAVERAERLDDPDGPELAASAEERIEDIEAEFGPNPPRRGATPQNPDAEERPT